MTPSMAVVQKCFPVWPERPSLAATIVGTHSYD